MVNGIVLGSVDPAEDVGSLIDNEVLRAQENAELAKPVADRGNATTMCTDATAAQDSWSNAYQVKTIRDGERSQASDEARVRWPPAAPQ